CNHLLYVTGCNKALKKAIWSGTPRHWLCFYRYHVFHYHQRCPHPQLCCDIGIYGPQSARGLRNQARLASDSPNFKAAFERQVSRCLGASTLSCQVLSLEIQGSLGSACFLM